MPRQGGLGNGRYYSVLAGGPRGGRGRYRGESESARQLSRVNPRRRMRLRLSWNTGLYAATRRIGQRPILFGPGWRTEGRSWTIPGRERVCTTVISGQSPPADAIKTIVEYRALCRDKEDWATADTIRSWLADRGEVVDDTGARASLHDSYLGSIPAGGCD